MLAAQLEEYVQAVHRQDAKDECTKWLAPITARKSRSQAIGYQPD